MSTSTHFDLSWKRCFLCSSPLVKDSKDSNASFENNSQSKKALLLKYLLKDPPSKNSLTKDVLHLVKENLDVGFCAFCEKVVDSVTQLQMQLESTQMKILYELSIIMKAIVSNSRLYGMNADVKDECDYFEEHIMQKEMNGENCEKERKFFEVLHQFQTFAFENESARFQIPLVYLEKYCGGEVLPSKINGTVMSKDNNSSSMIFDSNTFKPEPVDFYQFDDDGADTEVHKVKEELANVHSVTTCIKKRQRRQKTLIPKLKIKIEKRELPRRQSKTVSKLATAMLINSHSRPKKSDKQPKEISEAVKLRSQWRKESKDFRNGARKSSRKFQCAQCSFSTGNIYRVEDHLQQHETSEKSFECPDCRIKFTHKQTLENHLHYHVQPRKCDMCGKSVVIIGMKAHLLQTHTDKVFSCPRCIHCFGTFQNLSTHAAKHPGLNLKCGLCPEDVAQEYHTRTDLPRHLFESHGCADQLRKCDHPGCDKTFHGINLLKIHQITHTGRHGCNKCSKSFASKHILLDHNRRHHPEQAKSLQFACDSCDALFPASDPLLKHKIEMHNHPKVECDYCNPKTEFTTKSAYHMHIRVNHGKGKKFQTFTCSQCGKKFFSRISLESHEASHLGIKNYTCEVCGYATFSKVNLRRHSRIHKERERKYKCSYCEKGFYRKDALDNHIRTHTRERPFQCEECGAAFTQLGPLNAHKKRKKCLNGAYASLGPGVLCHY